MSSVELDCELMDIEVALEKAVVMQRDLQGDYFGDAKPDEHVLKFYYYDAMTRCSIIGDYLRTIEEKINSIKDALK